MIAWWRILSLDLISNYFRAFVDTLTHNSISPLLSFNGILSYLQADLLLRQEFWRIFIKRYPACSNTGVTFQTLHVTKCHEDKYFIISCQTGNVSFLLLKDLLFRTIQEFLFLPHLFLEHGPSDNRETTRLFHDLGSTLEGFLFYCLWDRCNNSSNETQVSTNTNPWNNF